MSVEARSAAARGTGVLNAAANLAREQISADQVLQWTLEGKCYTASIPMETASEALATALSDIVCEFALLSDLSGTKLIVPISTTLSLDKGNGSQIHTIRLAHSRPGAERAVVEVLTGTAMTITNNRSDGYGNNSASALYDCTSSIIAATEWVEVKTIEAYSGYGESTNHSLGGLTHVINHLRDGAPIILQKGAALMVTGWEGNGAALARCVFTWAELDASVYLP